MSLARILFKLGIGSTPKHADYLAATLKGAAANPSASGLGKLADVLESKAYGLKPRVGTRTEFHDSPRPITPQLDDAAGNAMYERTTSKGGLSGLGGEDVEWVDMTTDNLGRSYRPGAAERLDKIARLARRGERFARETPYAIEAGAALGLTPLVWPDAEDDMSILDKLKAKLGGL